MKDESRRLALAVAERLLSPDDVLATVPGPAGAFLAHGLAGTALLHARLSAIDPAFATAATRHWTAAAEHAKSHGAGTGPGVYSGGGLAASLIVGTGYLADPDRHRAVAARAAEWLSARALDLVRHHGERLQAGAASTPWWVYDTINGLAGIGRVLLAGVTAGHQAAEPGLIAALETLTTMIATSDGARPGWWLPAQDHPSVVTVHPSGAATTGLAHGIAGPLALLATAHTAGWSVAGQRTAIKDSTQWLLRWRTSPSCWPPYVSGDDLDRDIARPIPGRRDAWCYGTPGISQAIRLAGQALNDDHLTETANAAIASLADRPTGQWDTEGPTMCHGAAGVLACATTSGSRTAERAASAVITAFRSDQNSRFRHYQDGEALVHPGLLMGAAGIALALADHGDLQATAVTTKWNALFLLS